MILLAVNAEKYVIRDFLRNCKQMSLWLLLTDKRLNRQNKMIRVTLQFLVAAHDTSALLHRETMLITGSVYDLADTGPYFQTDSTISVRSTSQFTPELRSKVLQLLGRQMLKQQ